MDSFNDVFLEVLKYCHDYKTVSEPGYNRWIKILEPYKFENNVAYLLADLQKTPPKQITGLSSQRLLKT